MSEELDTSEVIHKSLHRPVYFLGVDRELGMTALLISAITAIGGYNLVAIIAAVIFWFASMHYLRKWTKQDPQIRDVFLRHIKYAKDQTVLFLAHPGVFCPARLNHWNKR